MHKSKYDRFLCVINEEFKQHLRYHSLRGYVFSFLHNDGRRTIIVYFRNRQLRSKGFEKFSISRDLFNKVEISPRIECTVAHVKHFWHVESINSLCHKNKIRAWVDYEFFNVMDDIYSFKFSFYH